MIINTLILLTIFGISDIQNNGYIEGDLKRIEFFDNENLNEKIQISYVSYSLENNTGKICLVNTFDNYNTGYMSVRYDRRFLLIDFENNNGIYKINKSQYCYISYVDFFMADISEYENGSISITDNINNQKILLFNITYRNVYPEFKKKRMIQGVCNISLDLRANNEKIKEIEEEVLIACLCNDGHSYWFLKYFYWIDIKTKKNIVRLLKNEDEESNNKLFKKLEVQDDGTIVVEYNNDK